MSDTDHRPPMLISFELFDEQLGNAPPEEVGKAIMEATNAFIRGDYNLLPVWASVGELQ